MTPIFMIAGPRKTTKMTGNKKTASRKIIYRCAVATRFPANRLRLPRSELRLQQFESQVGLFSLQVQVWRVPEQRGHQRRSHEAYAVVGGLYGFPMPETVRVGSCRWPVFRSASLAILRSESWASAAKLLPWRAAERHRDRIAGGRVHAGSR